MFTTFLSTWKGKIDKQKNKFLQTDKISWSKKGSRLNKAQQSTNPTIHPTPAFAHNSLKQNSKYLESSNNHLKR